MGNRGRRDLFTPPHWGVFTPQFVQLPPPLPNTPMGGIQRHPPWSDPPIKIFCISLWRGGGAHSHDKILSRGNMSPLRDLMGNRGGAHSYEKILSHGNMSPPLRLDGKQGDTLFINSGYDKILSRGNMPTPPPPPPPPPPQRLDGKQGWHIPIIRL